ncbi:MAG: His-Xaa-Ser system radical SAM maturase HxsB [Elusimicrobiota bacterium]|jgi:His-Xaa-Ser system radical SAM maturase HxsB
MNLNPQVLRKLDLGSLAQFYFKKFNDGRYLLTNDSGRYCFLNQSQFDKFLSGKVPPGTALFNDLKTGGFLKHYLDFNLLSERWRARHEYLWQATSLHIVVVTLRCNHHCVYCQTSSEPMDARNRDMTPETARRTVDRIFESPSPAITIELQGGEPLANWPAVRTLVRYAREKNRTAKKKLHLALVTNLSLMDEGKLSFLLKNEVSLCTSLDGPAAIHNHNRVFLGGSSHAIVVRWWKEIRRRTVRQAFRIDGLMTTTRFSLAYPEKIVDEYLRRGAYGMYLRLLNPFGFAQKTWAAIGYSPEEYLVFYRRAMDYILQVNRTRRQFFEQTARVFLQKILTDEDPGFMDIRSPCGAGIGQMAYNYDGKVYTCDEGRMLAETGDDSFRLGSVGKTTYAGLAQALPVRTLAMASQLDNQAHCSGCVYKPYCGICPLCEYAQHGDLFARPSSAQCRIHMGILDYLFEKMRDAKNKAVFAGWLRKAGRDR